MLTAIYARKSTEQNGVSDEEKSVTRQVDHAKAYAATKGWTVGPERTERPPGSRVGAGRSAPPAHCD